MTQLKPSTTDIPLGTARSTGPSVQSVYDKESQVRPVPVALRTESYDYIGSMDIDRARYTSAEFHKLEVERVWRKTWQIACRLDEIPNVGDTYLYEIVDDSLIVTRSGPDEVRAFHNSCLHRGTALRSFSGPATEFRCSFHGWSWNTDGTLRSIPCSWDFGHVEGDKFNLPEARVGTWGGWVFINMDPNAESLEKYLGVLPEHFKDWDMERRWKSVHVAKVLDANWKVTLEAFVEAYHVIATHPQTLPAVGDANTQYDTFGRHINRMITLGAVASPHLDGFTEQDVLDALMSSEAYYESVVDNEHDQRRRTQEAGGTVTLGPGETARGYLTGKLREGLTAQGLDLTSRSDAELIDTLQYFIFPNVVPWGGARASLLYRFRPYGNDTERCLFELIYLTPVPEGEPTPPPVPMHMLSDDESFLQAPEIGMLAAVFNQDTYNLPRIQKGLHASRKDGVTLGNYQEIRIRHFHQTLDEYVSGDVD